MTFTPIDLRTWPRAQVFTYFAKMAPTGYSLTVEVDVTRMRAALKAAGLRFFSAYLWLTTRCLMEQTEFCLAEREGQLGVYDTLTPLYATFHEDDHTFSMMWTPYDADLRTFHAAYLDNQRRFGANHGVLAQTDRLPPENAYTVSCVPWIGFRHFAVHTDMSRPYYFPSVEAGRFEERDGRLMMPLSITCHHAAADGWHVQRFLEAWQAGADGIGEFCAR